MQKATIKLYIKNRRLPLFRCYIADDAETVIKDLVDKLNDRSSDTVTFSKVVFRREEFRYLEIKYI